MWPHHSCGSSVSVTRQERFDVVRPTRILRAGGCRHGWPRRPRPPAHGTARRDHADAARQCPDGALRVEVPDLLRRDGSHSRSGAGDCRVERGRSRRDRDRGERTAGCRSPASVEGQVRDQPPLRGEHLARPGSRRPAGRARRRGANHSIRVGHSDSGSRRSRPESRREDGHSDQQRRRRAARPRSRRGLSHLPGHRSRRPRAEARARSTKSCPR